MKLKFATLLFAFLAIAFASCDDKEPEPEMVPGGVDLITGSNVVKVNGRVITMPAQDVEMIITLGSRGITPEGLDVIETVPSMSVELLDAYDPDKLEVYDRIKCQDGDKVWYDNLYKQRIKITASAQVGDPNKFVDRTVKIKVVPVGGYKVYSIFSVFHPRLVPGDKDE